MRYPKTFLALTLALAVNLLAQDAARDNEPPPEPSPTETGPTEAAPPDTASTDTASTDTASTETDLPAAPGQMILVGKIDGEISLSESAYVKRLFDAAREAGAEVVAIELNTFGGRVDAAVAIRDALLDAPFDVVVFINKRAISAGALISFAANKIAISPGGTIGAATPIVMQPGQQMAQPVEEKYVSYFRQEMRVTAEARGRDGDIAEAMVDADFEIEGLSEKGKLLTLNTTTALEHGIADIEAATLEEALDKLGYHGVIRSKERTWAEGVAAFLTSQAVASLLFTAMMVLGYMELQTPGFGFFGLGAVLCFLLVFYAHYLVNLAGWEDLLFFAVGVILILLEIFVIPGFGIAGVLGLCSILISAILVFQAGDWGDISFNNPFTQEAVMQVLIATAMGMAATFLMVRYVSLNQNSVLGRRLVLTRSLAAAEGFTSQSAGSDELVGAEGVVLTDLRPAGKALIAGKRRDVETEGEMVDKGATVRVLRRGLGQLVVRKIADAPARLADTDTTDTDTTDTHEERDDA